MRLLLALLTSILLAALAVADDQTPPGDDATMTMMDGPMLQLGAPAPPLTNVQWIKGEPVEARGKPTVIEIWATWCGPCLMTIPHLSKLQQRYGDAITVIGLSDEPTEAVEPFVKEMGERMNYHVGVIDPQERAYFIAEEPKPFAFVFDAKGMLVWSGHPLDLGRPIAHLVAGDFDPALEKQVTAKKMRLNQLLKMQQQGTTDAALELTANILKLAPDDIWTVRQRLALAKSGDDQELHRSILRAIPLEVCEPEEIGSLAYSLVTGPELRWRSLEDALRLARYACEKLPNDADAADTYARVLYTIGLIDEAIAAQTKACELAAGISNEDEKKFYADNLAYYKQALAAKQAFQPR